MQNDLRPIEVEVLGLRLPFENNVEGVEIHAECLSQDYDDIAWEPIVDDTPAVDPENDIFGYYD